MAKKITGFIIGAILVSVIATLLALNITTMAAKYNVDYDNTQLNKYSDQLSNITALMQETEDNTNPEIPSGSLDILGDFFKSGYTALKISYRSGGVVKEMAVDGISDTNIGLGDGNYKSVTKILTSGIVLMISVILLIGILISILVKREEI